MNQLLLLSTSACHLCEQAEALLLQLDITYQKIDIAEQEQWQERYAIKIPVLLNTENQKRAMLAFDIEQIGFLSLKL
ncbi:MAG: glutaredoxin family protein [Candidatus Methanofishera endochildressiae]|uniref:Glutaredoxin family protein n=1 Tax=Candidatus Methanofishera endochildressiae TaxID=2738884 RepID=A0A7Z0SDU0_9GAMM|nr:glutaredoxin family protein [Candidatus Methanofishera endochildressiae]